MISFVMISFSILSYCVKNGSSRLTTVGLEEPKKYSGNASALLFAGEGRKTVSAGCYLALFNAGLACREFRFNGQRAAPASGIAAGILPALVADPVFHGAHLRGIHSASEIKAVTGGETAG
jgi:hypothetical protein